MASLAPLYLELLSLILQQLIFVLPLHRALAFLQHKRIWQLVSHTILVRKLTHTHTFTQSLYTAMREHVELKFYSERTADEQVLQFYPSTIKRKVLRWVTAQL